MSDTTFNTIEEMVSYVTKTASKFSSDRKYMLRSRTDSEWVNEEEGEAWRDIDKMFPWFSFDDKGCEPAKSYYEGLQEKHNAIRPEMHNVTRWWLERSGDHYSRFNGNIRVSNELALQLDGIWKKVTKYGSLERTGWLTLEGMLKRLGKSDIGNQVKAAKKTAEEEAAKNKRNYNRREVNRLAKMIVDIMKKDESIIYPASIFEMAREDFMAMYGEK